MPMNTACASTNHFRGITMLWLSSIFFAGIFILSAGCTKKIVPPSLFVVNAEHPVVAGNNQYLSLAVFADTTHGFIFSFETCQLYKTNDGGTTWISCYNANGGVISNIRYPDPDTAFFTIADNVNHISKCYRSIDGGTNWVHIADLYQTCYLDYYSGKNGYAISAIPPSNSVRMVKTNNAGTSWANSSGNIPVISTNSIQFFNAAIGFAIWGSWEYSTNDGGLTWTSISNADLHTRISKTGISFKKDGTNKNILKSVDFGTTWAVVWHYTQNVTYLAFSDEGVVCASGNGCLLISPDMGDTWHYALQKDGQDFQNYCFNAFVPVGAHTVIGIGGPHIDEQSLMKITF